MITKKLFYLNAILKVNDINAGIIDHLNFNEKEMLGYCIHKERAFVSSLRSNLK